MTNNPPNISLVPTRQRWNASVTLQRHTLTGEQSLCLNISLFFYVL